MASSSSSSWQMPIKGQSKGDKGKSKTRTWKVLPLGQITEQPFSQNPSGVFSDQFLMDLHSEWTNIGTECRLCGGTKYNPFNIQKETHASRRDAEEYMFQLSKKDPRAHRILSEDESLSKTLSYLTRHGECPSRVSPQETKASKKQVPGRFLL